MKGREKKTGEDQEKMRLPEAEECQDTLAPERD